MAGKRTGAQFGDWNGFIHLVMPLLRLDSLALGTVNVCALGISVDC